MAVSDYKKQVTSTFHAFQNKFVPFVKERLLTNHDITCKKIIYFSDGSSAQYKKRKNVKNVALHEQDFGVKAEWHYFASCHGKGPCDGVGGTLKRMAARASLQGALIRNAKELKDWADRSISQIQVEWFSSEEIFNIVSQQEIRFQNVQPIIGMASLHCIIPQSSTSVFVKRFSLSEDGRLVHLHKTRTFVPWDSIQEYVLVKKEVTMWQKYLKKIIPPRL